MGTICRQTKHAPAHVIHFIMLTHGIELVINVLRIVEIVRQILKTPVLIVRVARYF